MMGRLVWALVYCVRHSEQLFIIVLVCSVVHDNKVAPMGDETGDCLLAEAGFSAHVSIELISQDSYWIYSVMSHLCIYQKQPDCNTDGWAVHRLMEDNVYLYISTYHVFFSPVVSLCWCKKLLWVRAGVKRRGISLREEKLVYMLWIQAVPSNNVTSSWKIMVQN